MPPFNYTGHLHRFNSELGLIGGVAVIINLKPTAIDHHGKKLPIQFTELNGSSLCNLLNLVWSQQMRLELPWKINKFTVIKEY